MKALGETARFWSLMRDGKPRSSEQIRDELGEVNLPRCIDETGRRFHAEISSRYAEGTYVYQITSAPGLVSEPSPQADSAASQPPSVSTPAGVAVGEGPGGSETSVEQLSLIDATRAALNATAPHGAVVVSSMLDRVDEAYASRLADRLRAEDSRRRLRVVRDEDVA